MNVPSFSAARPLALALCLTSAHDTAAALPARQYYECAPGPRRHFEAPNINGDFAVVTDINRRGSACRHQVRPQWQFKMIGFDTSAVTGQGLR
jgi:hypothetical protein